MKSTFSFIIFLIIVHFFPNAWSSDGSLEYISKFTKENSAAFFSSEEGHLFLGYLEQTALSHDGIKIFALTAGLFKEKCSYEHLVDDRYYKVTYANNEINVSVSEHRDYILRTLAFIIYKNGTIDSNEDFNRASTSIDSIYDQSTIKNFSVLEIIFTAFFGYKISLYPKSR